MTIHIYDFTCLLHDDWLNMHVEMRRLDRVMTGMPVEVSPRQQGPVLQATAPARATGRCCRVVQLLHHLLDEAAAALPGS